MKKIFYFNPDNEMAIANGCSHYMPPANIVRMSEELAYLPAYFSEKGDGIFVPHALPVDFLESRRELFGLDPELFRYEDLRNRKEYRIEPWGLSPRFYYLFREFIENSWKEEYRERYSRKVAKQCLETLCKELPFVDPLVIPKTATSLEELVVLVREGRVVIKAPWSSSGKGQLRIVNGEISRKEGEWLSGVLAKQGYVMVERLLDKKVDFAMQFHSNGAGSVVHIGHSAYKTGNSGSYQGNYVCSQDKIIGLPESYVGKDALACVKEKLTGILGKLYPDYKGYLGVDMMIYANAEGGFQIQPCVEINVRYNMGLLACALYDRFMSDGSDGFFSIDFFSKEGKALSVHQKNKDEFPLQISNNKIVKGYINLTPVGNKSKFIASLKVD